MVVLSSSEAISDLLDQRSAIYSDKVSASRNIRWISGFNPLILPSPAMLSNDRIVSLFDRWRLNNLIWIPRAVQDGSP